jgi:hypothetical protein
MNRLALSLLLVLTLPLASLSADIGENYAQGGIAFTGSVSYSDDFYNFADPAEQRRSWSLTVSPEISYYLVDRLSLQLSPWFYLESNAIDSINVDRSEAYGMSVGAEYALFLDPSAQQGFVVTVSGLVGLSSYPIMNDMVDGVETPNNYKRNEISLTVMPRLSYFLNDRTAVILKIAPTVYYILTCVDPHGAAVALTSQNRMRADVTVTAGVTYYLPSTRALMF